MNSITRPETPDRCRARLINTIGNLTLLTGELNASVSNGPFPGKVSKIVADSDLRLNAWLRDEPPSAWSEISIAERAGTLFETATLIWSRPQAPADPGEGVEEAPDVTESGMVADPPPKSAEGTWREDIRAALQSLGGNSPLWAIYAKVHEIRSAAGRSVPPSLDATVRQALEAACADSENYKGVVDWFFMPEGKGAGIWALRDSGC